MRTKGEHTGVKERLNKLCNNVTLVSCRIQHSRRKLFVWQSGLYVHVKAKASRTGTALHALGR